MDIKILRVIFIVVVIIVFYLISCGGKFKFRGVTYTFQNCTGDYFTMISSWYDMSISIRFYIVYANDTKVQYLIANGSITPLYNADETLQVYDERKE